MSDLPRNMVDELRRLGVVVVHIKDETPPRKNLKLAKAPAESTPVANPEDY